MLTITGRAAKPLRCLGCGGLGCADCEYRGHVRCLHCPEPATIEAHDATEGTVAVCARHARGNR